jgi:hypothetical protein
VFQEPESKIAAMIVVFARADLPEDAALAIHYSESGRRSDVFSGITL